MAIINNATTSISSTKLTEKVIDSLNGPKDQRKENLNKIKANTEPLSGLVNRQTPLENLYGASDRMVKIMISNSIKMNFIRKDHRLDSNGFVLRALKNNDRKYNLIQPFSEQPAHKIAFLKYFLFYDGAILISLLKKIFRDKEIEVHAFAPNKNLVRDNPTLNKKEWNGLLTKMFEEYETLTINRHDKTTYRTIKKNSKKIDYAYEYVRQLFPPRAANLADFGIIDYISGTKKSEIEKWLGQKTKTKKIVLYRRIDDENVTKKFLDLFPDVESLDYSFDSDGDFFERISKFYGLAKSRKLDSTSDLAFLEEHILAAYETVSPWCKGIVPLDTIRDIVCIKCLLGMKPSSESDKELQQMVNEPKICEVSEVNQVIEKLVTTSTSLDILNDRRGNPTYLASD